jgi:D-3-phosphoglycerate dehydrogenase
MPKVEWKVLVTDGLAAEAVSVFKEDARFHLDVRSQTSAAEVLELIPAYDALVVRSATKVTADMIARAKKLKVIARAGVGVDNIDVEASTKAGVLVVNTPEGNTISACEQTFALLLASARHIARADRSVRKGEWKRKENVGTELRGKTLAIVGLGKIGREVARRARAFDMSVIGFDPVVTDEMAREMRVELVSLDEVWKRSDFITLHVPLNEKTKHMISAKQLGQMKPNVRIVNCSRGGVIDEKALAEALKARKIGAAALDVFEEEPPAKGHPLFEADDATLTPHLGASTIEAQENVGIEAARLIMEFLDQGTIKNAVNAPALDAPALARIAPYRSLASKIGSLQAQLLDGKLKRFSVTYAGQAFGDERSRSRQVLTIAALEGFFRHYLSSPVNYVNVPHFAREHGIALEETTSSETEGYVNLLTVKIETTSGSRRISGAIFGERSPKITNIDTYTMDATPDGHMIFFANDDTPGMLGMVGTILGRNQVNIATVSMGRDRKAGTALACLNVDNEITGGVLKELEATRGIVWVRRVVL